MIDISYHWSSVTWRGREAGRAAAPFPFGALMAHRWPSGTDLSLTPSSHTSPLGGGGVSPCQGPWQGERAEPPPMLHAPRSHPAPCSTLHAPWSTLHGPWSMVHAPCPCPWSMVHGPCHASCAPCPCSLVHGAMLDGPVLHAMEHGTVCHARWSRAPCPILRSPDRERFLCSTD